MKPALARRAAQKLWHGSRNKIYLGRDLADEGLRVKWDEKAALVASSTDAIAAFKSTK